MNWKIGISVCTLPCIKQTVSGNLLYSTGSSARCSMVVWLDGMGQGVWEEGSSMGGAYVYRADSRLCTEETNTTL